MNTGDNLAGSFSPLRRMVDMSVSESNQGEYIDYDTPNKITVNEYCTNHDTKIKKL